MIILKALYFMLPAYIANMSPVLFKWMPLFDKPINTKLFGEHKTLRGIIIGTLSGIAVIFFQYKIEPTVEHFVIFNLKQFQIHQLILIGIAFGLGALIGDLIKSFFKRRIGIKEGQVWFPFDQLDFVIGALLTISIFYTPPVIYIFVILIITPFLHFLTNVIAYLLRLKKVWW